MRQIVRSAYHRDYAAAGEFYSVQQWVDPNYATSNGPYYDESIFVGDVLSQVAEKLSAPFETWVAAVGSKLSGFIVIEHHNGRAWINEIFIAPDAARTGVGRRLFETATSGERELYLWVNSKNPAVNFWGKLGFEEILTEKLMVKRS